MYEKNQQVVPKDKVLESRIPVLGVCMDITEVSCSLSCCDGTPYKLTVSDLDSGSIFKSILECDLKPLLQRQHNLVLGFTK